MKFTTSSAEIKKGLQILSPIVNHQHPVLAFRYLLLRKFGDRIEMKAFDNTTVASAFINVFDATPEVEEEGKAYVLAKHFMGLIYSVDSSDITFDVTEDSCKIKFGRSRYKLKMLDPEVANETLGDLDIDYYEISKQKREEFQGVRVDKFAVAYNSISHCLSKDDSQRSLQNVYCTKDALIACDGIRGAVCELDGMNLDGIMLHKKACNCIINIGNADSVNLISSDGKIFGYTDNFIFVTVLDEDYPYDSISPIIASFYDTDFSIKLKIDTNEVSDKLSRILMFADKDTNSIKIDSSEDGKGVALYVDNQSSAKETITVFRDNENCAPFSLFLDGSSFKEALSKSLIETEWFSNGGDSMQYIYDGSLLQFFQGLSD